MRLFVLSCLVLYTPQAGRTLRAGGMRLFAEQQGNHVYL
jgi:hypothetical protein